MNVIGIKSSNPSKLAKELGKRGWKIPFDNEIGCVRLVLMPHITKKVIDEFMEDLKEIYKMA
jgi:tyrosine decarboxylase/aspartate 1-decarboxylase